MINAARKVSELNECLCNELEEYFKRLEGHSVVGLYDMVIEEVEKSLFKSVMKYANNNQTIASTVLGISRGTLRKKLRQYGLVSG